MKISLDIDNFNFYVPIEFFDRLNKENDYVQKHGGTPVSVEERIRIAVDIALSNTQKHFHIVYDDEGRETE